MTTKQWLAKFLLGASLLPLVTFQAIAGCADNEIISVHCGNTPTSVFDKDGTLWTAFVQGQYVYVTHSHDLGGSFSPAIKANKTPQNIYTHGENRPKIALGNKGEIYTSWSQKTQGRFTGNIRFTRSLDGGQSFELPQTVNSDGLPIGHRFDALQVTRSGSIYVAWLDKREKQTAKKAGKKFTGISLYYAMSSDQGKSFAFNRKAASHSCECCRLAIAPAGDDSVKVMWRHIYDKNTRDHAMVTLSPDGANEPVRVSIDNWQTDACPHHGPDIDQTPDGNYHLTWFSNGNLHKGIWYGYYNSQTQFTSNIFSIDPTSGASHPQVKESNGVTYLVWKSFEDNATHIKMRESANGGKQWSEAQSIAKTIGASDYPLLIKDENNRLYLSWLTQQQGYQLIAIEALKR